MSIKTRTIAAGATALTIAGVATLAIDAQAHANGQQSAQTLHLVEKGGSLHIIDNPPKAKQPYDFSPGDVVIVTRDVLSPNGAHAGSLRLACTAVTPLVQHCSGTETLALGTLEVAGDSNPGPKTTAAIIGGTGAYAGARGTSTSQDRTHNHNIADQTIALLG